MPVAGKGTSNGSSVATEVKGAAIDLAGEARDTAAEVADDVAETAASLVEEARASASSIVGEAKSAAHEIVDEARATTAEIVQRARDTFSEQLRTRSKDLADRAAANGTDLYEVAEHLRSQGHEVMATVMETEASMFSRIGGYLGAADARTMFDDLSDAARKQPLIAAATGLTLGLAGARFLKASSERR